MREKERSREKAPGSAPLSLWGRAGVGGGGEQGFTPRDHSQSSDPGAEEMAPRLRTNTAIFFQRILVPFPEFTLWFTTPSSGLHRQRTRVVHRHTRRQNTHTHKRKVKRTKSKTTTKL